MDIAELLEKESIRDLVRLYSRGVDRQDFELLRTLYAEDGTDDHGSLYCGSAAGYVDWLQSVLPSVDITAHCIQNHLIDVRGDRGEGEVYVTAYHRVPAGDGTFIDLIEGNRYLDRYKKCAGVWRFEHRKLIRDWLTKAPTLPNWSTESNLGLKDGSDQSYQQLSMDIFRRGTDRR